MSRKMRDSGVEWIGDIPAGWEMLCNKYMFDGSKEIVGKKESSTQLLSLTTNGIRKRGKDEVFGKIPGSYETYQIVRPNDLVMCLFDLDCSAVFSGISVYDGMISPAYKVLKCRDGVNPAFYSYWFDFVFVDRKYKRYSKNVRYSLVIEEFGALKSVLPPLPEQRAIADYLDRECGKVDALRGKIEQQIAKLEEYKKSLITEAVTKGLDRNAKLKPSGVEWIGDVPEGWGVKRVKNVGNARNGLTYSPHDICDDGVLVLRSSNVQNGRLCFDDNVYVSCSIPQEIMMRCDDILICSRNGSRELIGKNAIVDEHVVATFGAFMMVFRASSIHSKFAYWVFNSQMFEYYLSAYSTSTINQLTRSSFDNMRIPLPPLVEQRAIAEYLDRKCEAIDATMAKCRAQLAQLAEYKKSLIFECVTGKREVA